MLRKGGEATVEEDGEHARGSVSVGGSGVKFGVLARKGTPARCG